MRSFLFLASTLVASSIALCACNEVKVLPAPDAGVNCGAPVPVGQTCKPQPAGTPGCTAPVPAVACFGVQSEYSLIDAGTYPEGCNVIYYNPTPDEDLQCTQLGGCNCYEDGGAYVWSCAPCIDASTQ